MNTASRSTLLLFGGICVLGCVLGGMAQATQPPDVVKSDGSANTAMGTDVLLNLTSGYYNTGGGYLALYANQTGTYNTAYGAAALLQNTGSNNTALGAFALELNESGIGNTAIGYEASGSNSSGGTNVAVGTSALQTNVSGSGNTAIGYNALLNATGSGNIGIGQNAGALLGAGVGNVYISNEGALSDGSVIRIGDKQTATYIAGIHATQLTGSAVYVTSSGQLGVLASSERFKTDVAPMGSATAQLARLRPVTFQLKTDASGTRQYGLIAEEVDKIYPELVIRDGSGRIQGVRYEELAPMLLNEVQQQERQLLDQQEKLRAIDQLKQQLQEQARQLAELKRQLRTRPGPSL
jgi:hypothetical protein